METFLELTKLLWPVGVIILAGVIFLIVTRDKKPK
jgi:hypothetical protein